MCMKKSHTYVMNGDFMMKSKKLEVGKKMIRSSLLMLLFSVLFLGCHVAVNNTSIGFDEPSSSNFKFPSESFTFLLVSHKFEFEEWPSVHTNDVKITSPYN